MDHSEQQAKASALFIESTRKQRCLRAVVVFVLGASATVYVTPHWPAAIICIAGLIIVQTIHRKKIQPDEALVQEFARTRNWFYKPQTELRVVNWQKRRVRFYCDAPLLSVGEIVHRLLANDFALRPSPPTGQVPRKQRTSRFSVPTHRPPAKWNAAPISPVGAATESLAPAAEITEGVPIGAHPASPTRKTQALQSTFAKPIPQDRITKFQAAANMQLREGVDTPDKAANVINRLSPDGKARVLTQALWNSLLAAGAEGEAEPNWEEIYQRIDAAGLEVAQSKVPSLAGQKPASNSSGVSDSIAAPEGTRKRRTNYAIVRSAKLRNASIAIHGRKCCVCGFSFDEAFGVELAQGYIEVHHLNQIASGVRDTDPATDLVPLCSNCHAMADRLARHHPSPPSTIDELRKLLSR